MCYVQVDRVNEMVETVKHAIVLLQIAKNASCPEPGGEAGREAGLQEEAGVGEEGEAGADTESR